jgi:hypothetical protein
MSNGYGRLAQYVEQRLRVKTYQVGDHDLGFAAGSCCWGGGNILGLLRLTRRLCNAANGSSRGSRASGTTAGATAASVRSTASLEDLIERLVELSGRHDGGVRSDCLACVGRFGVQEQRKKRAVVGQRTRRDGRDEISGDDGRCRGRWLTR